MTAINKHSSTWSAVKVFCSNERKQLLQDLIAGSPNDDLVRGQIQFIDKLLEMEDEPPERPPSPSVSYT